MIAIFTLGYFCVIGVSDGIVVGLRHEAVEQLAIAHPSLGLKMGRMLGALA